MANYALRNIPDALWQRCRARASDDGLSMRAIIILLLHAYVEGPPEKQRPDGSLIVGFADDWYHCHHGVAAGQPCASCRAKLDKLDKAP